MLIFNGEMLYTCLQKESKNAPKFLQKNKLQRNMVDNFGLEQRHRVVSRDEVLAQVWSTRYVGEETLTSCVKAVRRAVGDSGRTQRVIQTVHGRGLRFVAEVTVTAAALAPCTTTARPVQAVYRHLCGKGRHTPRPPEMPRAPQSPPRR
jgi:hypothetical protein